MAQTSYPSPSGLTLFVTDTCFRCAESTAIPAETSPGDAIQCSNCGGWLEVFSRFSPDGKRCSIWLNPFDGEERR